MFLPVPHAWATGWSTWRMAWRLFWRSAALAALLATTGPAGATASEGIAQQVDAIEAASGSDPEQVIAALRGLEAKARALGGRDLVKFLAAWGYAHGALNQPVVADAAVDELTHMDAGAHTHAALASAYALKANLLQFAGRLGTALDWINAATDHAALVDDPHLQYWVYMSAGDIAVATGRLELAVEQLTAALGPAEATRNDRRVAQVHLALAPLYLALDRPAQALAAARAARRFAGQAAQPSLVQSADVLERLAGGGAGAALAFAASPGPAERSTVNPEAGGPDWLADDLSARLYLASLYLSAGRYEAAESAALAAQQQAHAMRDRDASTQASLQLGMALIGNGRLAEGSRLVDFALGAMSPAAQDAPARLLALNRYASVLERSGHPQQARVRVREAAALEDEIATRDRLRAVQELQQRVGADERSREWEALQHRNDLQTMQLASRRTAVQLVTAILALVAFGLGLTVWLYAKLRRSHRMLQARNTELEYIGLHDPVTGLGNRHAIEQYTHALRHSTYQGIGISIKRFGLILGSLGHEAGDQLVRQIASRLDRVISSHGGRLFRLDGYTFGANLDDRGLRVPIASVLDELAAAMVAPFRVGNQDLVVTVCMGAAHYPTHGSTAGEVARCVEIARRRAHAEPGNSYAVYDEGLMALERNRLKIEGRLSHAVARGELQLHYQPQHALDDGRVVGFEALLRWQGPDGPVPPGVFIPVAEDSGLIVSLGGWVLAEACHQTRAWADMGHGDVTVSINISPRQFRHPEFMDTLRRVLLDTGASPAAIELEITEGAMMEDGESAIAQLHALRALGLKLAIDDFGTGHASLSYLRRFPLNRLKIDQSFVQRLGVHDGDGAIVHALIGLGHTLGMAVTAEGVETIGQEAALRAWGCDTVQGFLHGRPMPAAGATRLLQRSTQLG